MEQISTVHATYCGLPVAPQALLQAWNMDWRLLLALLALLITVGVRTRGRQRRSAVLGWTVLVIAFVSPLCALTVSLVSARAVHHLLLLTVAAPCLAVLVPRTWQRWPSYLPLLALLVALVLWHVPAFYAWAWDSSVVYWLGQLALLLPAMVFWAALLAPLRERSAASAATVLPALSQVAVLAGVMGLLGAVLSFAPQTLYPVHGMSAWMYGLQPLQDQQLAGLLMWVPGFVPLAAIAAHVLYKAWQHAAGAQGAAIS